jgi:hypothetical protein
MSLKVEDKLEISELLSRYNLSMDRNDVEGWLNTWLDDGAFIANFGEARGKKELEELMKRILSEFASGKRHVTTNLIVGREEKKRCRRNFLPNSYRRKKKTEYCCIGVV